MKLTWTEIKDYPKSADLLRGFVIGKPPLLYSHDLCDFFDKQEIRVWVSWTIDRWFYWIGSTDQSKGHFEDRQDAERAGFIKAFEILEEKCQ